MLAFCQRLVAFDDCFSMMFNHLSHSSTTRNLSAGLALPFNGRLLPRKPWCSLALKVPFCCPISRWEGSGNRKWVKGAWKFGKPCAATDRHRHSCSNRDRISHNMSQHNILRVLEVHNYMVCSMVWICMVWYGLIMVDRLLRVISMGFHGHHISIAFWDAISQSARWFAWSVCFVWCALPKSRGPSIHWQYWYWQSSGSSYMFPIAPANSSTVTLFFSGKSGQTRDLLPCVLFSGGILMLVTDVLQLPQWFWRLLCGANLQTVLCPFWPSKEKEESRSTVTNSPSKCNIINANQIIREHDVQIHSWRCCCHRFVLFLVGA